MDGEGYIFVYQNNRKGFAFGVGVSNTDKGIIDKLISFFGGKVSVEEPKGKKSKAYHWSIRGVAAGVVLQLIRPYLVYKGPQADVFQEVIRTYQRGYPLTEKDIALRLSAVHQLKELKKANKEKA